MSAATMVLPTRPHHHLSTCFPTTSRFAAGPSRQVGLLDIDICGPSIPKMLGLEGQEIHQSNLGWSPVYVEDNLGVMSIGEGGGGEVGPGRERLG